MPFDNTTSTGVEIQELRLRAEEAGLLFLETIDDRFFDPLLVDRLPVEWARAHAILPVRWNNEVAVLTADPDGFHRLEEVSLLLGCEVKVLVAPRAAILPAIERCYVLRRDRAEDFLLTLASQTDAASVAPVTRMSEDLLRVSEEAPITQLVNLILLEAVKSRASDIHFEPGEDHLRIRYRIDGVLYEQTSPPKHMERALVSRLKVMARLDIAERRLPQDGMTRVRLGERLIDIRVSTVPVAEGERVVLRLLNRDNSLRPLSDLGMPDTVCSSFADLLKCANGLIIVSGPTGSGKTTTLYAALGGVDTHRRNVMTIEDPIEYQLPAIGQIQVHPKIGLTFAIGLRHILRQDPDVILVGETRDRETAEIALRASLTGHLVFTTLHTNDAASAVLRLVDMGIEPYLLSAALRGVMAQRLVRRLCPHCRKSSPAPEVEIGRFGEAGARLSGKTVWYPVGCDQCREGYWGRVGLFELLMFDNAIQELIRSGEGGIRAMRNLALRRGMRSLKDDGIEKILSGVTSIDEVLYAVNQLDA